MPKYLNKYTVKRNIFFLFYKNNIKAIFVDSRCLIEN